MTKQLLFYENAVPVAASRHADVSVEPGTGYAFASQASAVPIMAVEFLVAATEYAIVFTAAGDEVVPAVVLGLRNEQNLYLGEDKKWQAKYVPAFIRRYPFVFSTKELGILEPSTVRVTAPGAEKIAVGGFMVVDRKKLRELPGDKLAALAKTDELELLYLHLYSLRNFSDIKDRLIGSVPAEAEEPAGVAVVH